MICTGGSVECELQSLTKLTGAACLVVESGAVWSFAAKVAVVENLECFLHFEDMNVPADVALYASGRLSDLVLDWIGSESLARCEFVHCGDYDPVGLDEYLRVKAKVGTRVRLHLPPNLRVMVETYGRSELVADSEGLMRKLRGTTDPDARMVMDILDETGCGLEQEALLIV